MDSSPSLPLGVGMTIWKTLSADEGAVEEERGNLLLVICSTNDRSEETGMMRPDSLLVLSEIEGRE